MQIFIKQGIKAVRMDDIARQMGISKRTLYELFADKETLLYMAVERYFERCDERRTAMCADARNVLEAIFIGLSDVMAQSETTDRIMGNLRRFYPAVYGRMLREGAEKTRRGIREGTFPIQDQSLCPGKRGGCLLRNIKSQQRDCTRRV